MMFYEALRAELGRVDAENWQAKLDALHRDAGTWTATADKLGVSRRALERWRFGYMPRRGPRRRVDPSSFIGKIRDALDANRRAQVNAVNWKNLEILGTITIGKKRYVRRENMYVGKYLEPETVQAIVRAYIQADPKATQRAIDDAMALDYIGDEVTTLDDVEELHF